MARKAITLDVMRRLFALSGNQCAFPGCDNLLIDENGVFLAEICHIEAANEGGERFNNKQSDDDRRSYENFLLLCHGCHKKTDNIEKFPSDKLRKLKEEHERLFSSQHYRVPEKLEEKILHEFNIKFETLFQLSKKTLETSLEIQSSIQNNQESQERIESSQGRMEQMLATVLKQQQDLATDKSKIYSEQLDFIKQFRTSKQPQTALNMLLKYKVNNWSNIDAELQYKVQANLGTLYFELGQKELGAAELIKLKAVKFESADSLAYLCLGYAVLRREEEFAEAFDKAFKLQEDNTNLWVAYINLKSGSTAVKEIKEQLPQSVLEKPEILYALGVAYMNADEDDEGLDFLARAIDDSKGIEENWHAQSLIESSRLTKVATLAKIAFNRFSADELKKIEQSRNSLTKIWERLSQTELAASAWHIVLNKGIANKILGNTLEAEQDLEEAWRLSKSFFAFKDLLFHYLDVKRFDRAEALISTGRTSAFAPQDNGDFAACQARYYMLVNQVDKAIETLTAQVDKSEGEDRVRLFDLLILCHFESSRFLEAEPVIQRLITEFDSQPEGYLAAGIFERIQNHIDEALTYLYLSKKRAFQGSTPQHVFYQLGQEFSNLGKHEEAVSCLEKIVDPKGYDFASRLLAVEYLRTDEYNKAIVLCETATSYKHFDPLIYEVLFKAYYAKGALDKAEEILLTSLATDTPQSLDAFRLLGVQFYIHSARDNDAVNLILEVKNFSAFDLTQRFACAQKLIDGGLLAQGLEIAFDARLDHYDLADAHQMYVSCCLNKHQPQEEMFPQEVGLDCAVVLMDQLESSREYFLTDNTRFQGSNVLPSDRSLAKLVIGKKRGDVIEMPNSVGVGSVLTIRDILNKYVYAFRESLALLETRFAGETNMKFLKWGDDEDNVSGITEYFRQQAVESRQKARQIFKYYDGDDMGEIMTVGMLAHSLHLNFIETWLHLINSTETFLRSNDQDESSALADAITRITPVIVDPIALLSLLWLLPSSDILSEFPCPFIVARSTITELSNFKTDLESSGPRLSVAFEEGELRRHEYSQDQVDSTVALVEKIIDWCERNTTIKSPVRPSPRITDKNIDILEVIGHAFHDSVLLAKSEGALLLSDDARLKSFALAQYNVKSFSTFDVATHKWTSGLIPLPEYNKICRALVVANYGYIPISGSDLWTLFDESLMKVQMPFTRGARVLKRLAIPHCVRTLADFAKLLYTNISLPSLRDQTMLYILRETQRNANNISILRRLMIVVSQEFKLMPLQQRDLTSLIGSILPFN